uniref:Uncharacterized protein n=1 Tax=Arundo donax TaxID=35708 RepID=A0A0A9GZC3_ARUDO
MYPSLLRLLVYKCSSLNTMDCMIYKSVSFLQGGLVLVRTHVRVLRAPVAMLDHGHTLLPLEGAMTTLLRHGQRKSTRGHQDRLKNMTGKRSEDPIPLMIERTTVVQTMVMMRGHQEQRRNLGSGGGAGHRLSRLEDHGQDRHLLPAAADVFVDPVAELGCAAHPIVVVERIAFPSRIGLLPCDG